MKHHALSSEDVAVTYVLMNATAVSCASKVSMLPAEILLILELEIPPGLQRTTKSAGRYLAWVTKRNSADMREAWQYVWLLRELHALNRAKSGSEGHAINWNMTIKKGDGKA